MWRISDDATQQASDFEKLYDSLDKVLDGFLRTDNAGRVFSRAVDSPRAPKEIRLVAPKDFESRKNQFYGRPKKRIKVFEKPDPRASDYPALHFSKTFYSLWRDREGLVTQNVIRKIEQNEIHPVCPFCISDLPYGLFGHGEPVRVIKLGLIGPAESGKTSFNVINILFECLKCGGWEVEEEIPYVNPYDLSAGNYYKSVLKSGKLPPPTPDRYIPPLLLRLKNNSQNILLSLLDIPSCRLKTIREDIANHRPTSRTSLYMKLFEQMDGWLLMLDAEREILPKINSNEYYEASENQETLESLLQIFSRISEPQLKPAALVITKCDLLFTNAPGNKLFDTCSPVEQALWQQTWEDFQKTSNLKRQPKRVWQLPWRQSQESEGLAERTGRKEFYSADRHEIVQYTFKPLIKRYFPELTDQLDRYFSKADIFPESNWGSYLGIPNIQEKQLNKEWVKPFYSAEPIFWLMDIIRWRKPSTV